MTPSQSSAPAPRVEAFFAACAAGELDALRRLLDEAPELVRTRHEGTTGLHRAASHAAAVCLLLERGADPNARDEGNGALPLHFAAGGGSIESARVLLEAGSDPRGEGDAHQLEVIGWATVFGEARRDVADLLVERGARHHVFSAIALADTDLLRHVVAEDPGALRRRLSEHEQEQTALHYVVAPPDGLVGGLFRTGDHYRTLETLIELGADLEARDAKGRTALELAMLRGDERAMRLLHAAGARVPLDPDEAARPEAGGPAIPGAGPAESAASLGNVTPMLGVADMPAAIAWYGAVGFQVAGTHGEAGRLDWAAIRCGLAEIMLVPAAGRRRGAGEGVSLWIRTDRLDHLYARLKRHQLARARKVLAGETPDEPDIRFTADLYTAFYGQREFGVRDPNGVELMFFQPLG